MPTPKTPLRRTRSFNGSDSYPSTSSSPRPGFLSFRARQFGASLTPSSIEGISPAGTHKPQNDYHHNLRHSLPLARPIWSPSPTPHGCELKTPVLYPSKSPDRRHMLSNASFVSTNSDTPGSVRGVGNGGILVGKIRELQKKLEDSEKENKDIRTQLRELQEGSTQTGSDDDNNDNGNNDNDNDNEEHRRRLSTNTSLRDNNDSMSSDQSAASVDETIIQGAMTSIQTGVNQLDRALRRLSRSGSLGGSGSFQSKASTSSLTSSTTLQVKDTIQPPCNATTTGFIQGDVICGHGTPSWWSSLQCGDMVDGRDKDREWYAASIESIEACGDSDSGEDEQFRVLVSFEGWSSEWDLWLHSERDIAELAPRGTHLNVSESKKRSNQEREFVLVVKERERRKEMVEDDEDEDENKNDELREEGMSIMPDDEDENGVNLSRGSTEVGSTTPNERLVKSWDLNQSLSPVEYLHSLGGSSRMESSPLKKEMFILSDGRSVGPLSTWRVDDVLKWVSSTLELPEYVASFQKCSVDGTVLSSLTKDDILLDLGVKNKMHGKKIQSHLELLRLELRRC